MAILIKCKCGHKQEDYSDSCRACKERRKEEGLGIDPKVCGEYKTILCGKCNASLRTSATTYWIDYYDGNGRRRRKKIGPQRSVAEIALKNIDVKKAKEEHLGIYEDKKTLFKDFAEKKYLPIVKPTLSPSSYERFEGIVNTHLIPYFQCPLYKVSRKMIEEYIQKRDEAVAPATVNQELKRIRHMMNKAVEWKYIKENPCKGVKNLKEPPGRIRYITPEELERLLNACSPESLLQNPNNKGRTFSKLLCAFLKPIALLAIHTGARRSEVLSLRWKDIDFKEKRIMLEVTKNGERRTVPMNQTVYDVLKSLPVHLGNDLVFPGIERRQLTVAFRRACKRGGLEDFRLHDCRHSFASYLSMAGENLRTVQTLLGHKDLRMTMRYSHLSPAHLREAVATLDKSLKPASSSHFLDTGQEKRG